MTTQELPERRPKKIDLNLLPPEYLPQKVSRLTIGLVIAAIILACAPWPFLIMKSSVDAENETLQNQYDSLQIQLQQLNSEIAACNLVQDEIDAAEEILASMEEDYQSFQDMIYLWSVIFDDVRQTPKGAGGELGDIDQGGQTISIDGMFTKEKYVYEYAVMLEQTGHFKADGVTINSIKLSGEGGSEMYSFGISAELKAGGEQ
jgi:Tfp pilus assembly protein PilN